MQEETLSGVQQLRALVDAATEAGKSSPALIGQIEDFRALLATAREAEVVPLLRRLAAVRGWGGYCKDLLRDLRGAWDRPALRVVSEDEPSSERGLAAGLPEGWVDPAGYCCADSGVWMERETPDGPEEVRVAPKPIWIARRWRDVDSGDHLVELAWPGASEVVKRSLVLTARDLPALADKGAPVSSVNARGVVQWLQASEDRNDRLIPVDSSIGRVGWIDRQLQGAKGPYLLRAEDGHKQTAKALAPRGKWDEWLAAAKVVHKQPVPALLLAASVASVFLEATGAAPFVVDLHGHSSRGKTTALRWAASAWADPTDAGGYLVSWSATMAFIEDRAGFLRNLPLCLDDTKKVQPKDREKLAALVYAWGSGQAKGRARPDGVRATAVWRSILLSTGEAPLTRLAGEHVGLRLRVLPISEQPFPDGDEAVGVIEGLDAWGLLAPKVEAWALDRWDGLAERWEKIRAKAAKVLNGGPSSQRLAGYIASVKLGVEALQDLGVPMPVKEITEILTRAGASALASSDTATEAWDRIGAWLVANSERITGIPGVGEEPKVEKAPSAGWLGRAMPGGVVAVVPALLDAELRRMGYDPEEALQSWNEQGRIVKKDGSFGIVTRWLGRSTRLYRLTGFEGWTGYEVADEL